MSYLSTYVFYDLEHSNMCHLALRLEFNCDRGFAYISKRTRLALKLEKERDERGKT